MVRRKIVRPCSKQQIKFTEHAERIANIESCLWIRGPRFLHGQPYQSLTSEGQRQNWLITVKIWKQWIAPVVPVIRITNDHLDRQTIFVCRQSSISRKHECLPRRKTIFRNVSFIQPQLNRWKGLVFSRL